jgi:hypothetical protein
MILGRKYWKLLEMLVGGREKNTYPYKNNYFSKGGTGWFLQAQ